MDLKVILCLVLYVFSVVALPSPLSESRFPCECSDGKQINAGMKHEVTDCEICFCHPTYGVQTKIADCFFPGCVDSVQVENDGNCCPICPNGRNCEATLGTNKTIIPYGEKKQMNGAICYCVENLSHDLDPNNAICDLHVLVEEQLDAQPED